VSVLRPPPVTSESDAIALTSAALLSYASRRREGVGRAAIDEVKQRHRGMWGNGPYQNVTETIADIHATLVERLRPEPGERWLDLACGTGAVAEGAARAGAAVTGIDLTPALIETARERAAAAGLAVDYRVGDCERLDEIADGSFEIVSSSVGIMFAPDQPATARELARVTASGGRLGLASWELDGGVGDLFRLMAPFQPPPAPGARPPFAWGDEAAVRELLGEAFELELEHRVSTYRAASGEEYWQLFASSYGPTKTLAESLDDERRDELHRSWVEFFESRYRSGDEIVHPREYLLVLGTRR
jgi:ubiquinone/menaquinone biosynthesis C-methylase UbiE